MIAAGQNQNPLKVDINRICRNAGVQDAEACAKAVSAAIDTYRLEEQRKQLKAAAQIPDDAKCMTPSEYKMFELLNRDRVRNGIKPVAIDCNLVQSARGHSADMARFDYFDHKNREGKSPHERILAKTKRFRCTAENIARGGTGSHAFTWDTVSDQAQVGLFNSPGHRANILNPDLTHVGIGIYQGSLEGAVSLLYVTQNFGGCE